MKKSILKTPLTFKEKIILKIMLLTIWFVKNLGTLVYIFLSVCLMLTLFTVIKPSTPLLGAIFGGLSEDVTSLKEMSFNFSNIVSILVKVGALITTVVLFGKRLKTLTETDIHSKKLKILIYRAGYRYDIKNGSKLMKHVAMVGDKAGIKVSDNIEDIETVDDSNVIDGIKRVTNEFVSIITVNPNETVSLDDVKNGVDVVVDNSKVEIKKLNGVVEIEKKLSLIQRIKLSFKNFIKKIKVVGRMNTMEKHKDEKVLLNEEVSKEVVKEEKEIIVVKRNNKSEDSLDKANNIKEVVEEVVEKVVTVTETILDKITPSKKEATEEVVEEKTKEPKVKKSPFVKKEKPVVTEEVAEEQTVVEQPKPVVRKELSKRERLESRMSKLKK